MKQNYYITTPIYYPSGKWHLGTCYTTVVCDALARFKRLSGFDVFYLTGTDEHGQKMEKVAKEKNMEVKKFVDKQVDSLKELWTLLDITYDKFIRTTDGYHEKAVQKIFQKLYDQGDIYKSEYEGWYCTPCESFWTKTQLLDGKCPDCGREVELTKETSYFFRLSKYQDRLIKLIEENPEFLQPKSRQNEMLNNFLKAGLQDLAVSRTSFKWGVPVPFDPEHVVYVWIDALTNYITALGYGTDDDALFQKYWPADLHMMGKEIVRFHSIIWPAILMALDIPLPKKVYGHGWLLLGNNKISKSRGNIIDPFILSERYSVDAVRYYLLREIPFGSDGMYTNYAFLSRINADLCNSLGNLLSRTSAMVNQYFGGILPKTEEKTPFDDEIRAMTDALYGKVEKAMDGLQVPDALNEIFTLLNRANKYIDETAPWTLAKDESKRETLKSVLYHLVEVLRVSGAILAPFLPKTSAKILSSVGYNAEITDLKETCRFGLMTGGEAVTKMSPLFPRIDIEKELVEMEKISAEAERNNGDSKVSEAEITDQKSDDDPQKSAIIPLKSDKTLTQKEDGKLSEIGIEDFLKVELKIGKILTAEKVEKSKKLLHFTVDTGERVRSIASGVAKFFTPEEMVGKEVIVVTNLKSATLGGVLSEGMILFGENENGLFIVGPHSPAGAGSTVG